MLGKIIATIKLSGRKHIGDNTNMEKIKILIKIIITIKLSGIKHVGDNTNMEKKIESILVITPTRRKLNYRYKACW